MNRQIMSTQVNINMSVTTDNDFGLLVMLFIFWLIRQVMIRIRYEVSMFAQDFREALNFTGKVLTIGFNSVRFAL